MDVSIIIVNYKTINLVINAIDSIFDKTIDIVFELIIVDNNSGDDSMQILFTRYNDKIKYLSLTHNIGFGRANNEAIKIAKGRNILFLNPDTILLNNAIKILSDYLDTHGKVGGCGGNLFDENLNQTHSFRRIFPSIFCEVNDLLLQIPEKLLYKENIEHNFTDKPLEVAYITGADLMVKRSVLDNFGSFNPRFFMYYEETELCWRIHQAGFSIMSEPKAKIQHLEGGSTGNMTINLRRMEMLEIGRSIFYSLCYTKLYTKLANSILLLNMKSRIVAFSFKKNIRYTFWKNRFETFIKINNYE